MLQDPIDNSALALKRYPVKIFAFNIRYPAEIFLALILSIDIADKHISHFLLTKIVKMQNLKLIETNHKLYQEPK